MIDKDLLARTVADAIAGTDLFVVEIGVAAGNSITVEIDSPSGVDIEACAAITRRIEEAFDRDVEDYELEVGSSGLTSPLKVRAQFDKYLGKDVEVLTRDGRKIRGVLASVTDGDPMSREVDFAVDTLVKVKEPGQKRPVETVQTVLLNSGECKYVRYDLKF